jgi:hypothetical protein
MLDGIGIACDVARFDQAAGDAVDDEAARAGGVGADDGEGAGHGFGCDVAEGFGDAGLQQQICRGDGAAEIGAVLVPGEDRVGDLSGEGVARGAIAEDQDATPRALSSPMVSPKTSIPFSRTSRPKKSTTKSSSLMPSERRHSRLRRAGLNTSRSMPRPQMPMSKFIRSARRTSAKDSDGATMASHLR